MSTPWNLNDPPTGDDIAAALATFPVVADALRQSDDLTRRLVPFTQICSFNQLFPCLSPLGLRLLQLDRFHGGVTRDTALAEAPDMPPELLDVAASSLVIAGLAQLVGTELRSHPDLSRYIPMALPMFEDDTGSIKSDRLGTACRHMGLTPTTIKAERVEMMLQALRDPAAVARSLSTASAEARRLFERIVELTTVERYGFADGAEPAGYVALNRLIRSDSRDYWAASRDLVSAYSDRAVSTPIGELVQRLLISTSHGWGDELWLYLDVAHTQGLALGPALKPPPETEGTPVQETPTAPTRVVAQLGDVVAYLGDHPVEGKKSGDRRVPVATWRSAAKATGIPKELGVLLGGLAADLGLIYARALPLRGRGRKVQQPVEWRPNPRRVAEFGRLEVGTRWLAMIDAWLGGGRDEDAYANSVKRSLTVSVLASLPDGRAIDADDFVALATSAHLAISEVAMLKGHLQATAALGLIGDAAMPGLTAAGRAAIAGADAVNELLGGGDRSFLVQPDHSVMAPPDLAPDVAATLMRYADLESEGGASVWRLSARRLAQAAPTTSAEEVQAFLSEGSSVPVPDAVLRFVGDAMVSVSPVSVERVGCVITADDPVVIIDAARHKTAKLTVVAPGVATSPLTPTRVRDVLATKGVVLASASSAEATVTQLHPIDDADAEGARAADNAAAGDTAELPLPVSDAVAGWVVDQPDPKSNLFAPKPIGYDDSLVEAICQSASKKRL